MSPIDIIVGVIGLIKFLTGGVKLDKEADVENAIKSVERKVGLTDDIKWAYNWFDHRYEHDPGFGPTIYDGEWHSYCHYAGHTIKIWDDVSHWQECCQATLERIQYYITQAIEKYQIEHPGETGYEFQPWYIKYLPYGLMAGLGTALIIVLARRR